MSSQLDRDLLAERLYRIFRIKDEAYVTTVKLLYIYDWMEPVAGLESFQVIEDMRKFYPKYSNEQNLDAVYRELKIVSIVYSGKYDTSSTNAPITRDIYYSGWKVA